LIAPSVCQPSLTAIVLAFNKLYTLKLAKPEKSYVMGVSLPVHPHLKTESEAATLEWLKRETSIPVPRVIAMCSDSNNELGFEWMLIEHMPGTVLAEAWGSLSWTEKESVTMQIAACIAELNARKFKGIGSLFVCNPRVTANSPERQFEPGALISMEMFWGTRIKQDIFRGPFKSKDWLEARLYINIRDFEKLENESDDEEIEDLEGAIALAEDLQKSLPQFFQHESIDEVETTSLFHDDLNMSNILVHEGELSAILDWECSSALPSWISHSIPRFLYAPIRRHFDRKNYAEDAESEPGSLLPGHRLEFEQTLLRDVFKAEMERLQPGWNATYEQSSIKADFDQAVGLCHDMFRDAARNWLDKTRAGKLLRLN
jgi:hypothetical protein